MSDPLAWRTFDGEGGYDYRTYEDNETYRDDYIARNGPRYRDWVEPLYTTPPDHREAMRMALDALEQSRPLTSEDDFVLLVRQHQQAIIALRAALGESRE
jgi:hypothetical protein